LKGSYQPAIEADVARAMQGVQQKNPDITDEQLQQMETVQSKIASVAAVVIVPITALVIGLAFWLLGKFVGATETLGQAMLIATFASFPRIVGFLAVGIQGLFVPEESIKGMSSLSLGPARFLDPDTASSLSVAMAMRFDVTLIWITLLLAIGLKVVGKMPMNKAMIPAVLVWLVGSLLGVGGAVMGGG